MQGSRITRRGLIGGAAAGTAITVMPTAGQAAAKKPSAQSADVVVVGAGLAGLTAARGWWRAAARCWCSRRATGLAGACSATRSAVAPTPSSAGCSPGRRRTHPGAGQRVGVGLFPTYNTGNNVFIGATGDARSSRATRRWAPRPPIPWSRRTSRWPLPSWTRWPRSVDVDAPWDRPTRRSGTARRSTPGCARTRAATRSSWRSPPRPPRRSSAASRASCPCSTRSSTSPPRATSRTRARSSATSTRRAARRSSRFAGGAHLIR